MADILVVDDEIGIRELLSEVLGDEGHSVLIAENAAAARKLRAEQTPDLVLLDIWMPDTDGVTLLREWASTGLLTMPVVMMSGHATIDTAVEATRIGAVDFLEKPIALQKLLAAVESALARRYLIRPDLQPPTVSVAQASPDLPEVEVIDPNPAFAELALNQPLREARDAFEKAYFTYHLHREGGSMTRVAERTGLERTHLYRKLKQLGLDIGRQAYRKL